MVDSCAVILDWRRSAASASSSKIQYVRARTYIQVRPLSASQSCGRKPSQPHGCAALATPNKTHVNRWRPRYFTWTAFTILSHKDRQSVFGARAAWFRPYALRVPTPSRVNCLASQPFQGNVGNDSVHRSPSFFAMFNFV